MICPNCQTTNPAGARFCSDCGAALSVTCPNCGTSVAAGTRFCHNCGHRLAAAEAEPARGAPPQAKPAALEPPAPQPHVPKLYAAKLEAARSSHAMEGERRVVTILFCDVKGSTAMAEQLDPEEWAEIMNGAFEHLMAPVYRYEGTVARLMGDAILAFFGAPIAHEDDPQRAVLAGLGIVEGIRDYREKVRRERGLDFNVRVGINTGLVVVGEVGSDLRVEYTAMGDTVNLAARMEQTAQPGTVQVAANTHKLIAPIFEFEALGGIEVRGKTEPVPAYRAIAPKAKPGRLRGIEGLESPLVGREKEMEALQAAVAGLLGGRGQIVSVMGEAGLGKSRLVAELHQSLAANRLLSAADDTATEDRAAPADRAGGELPIAVGWHEGRSLSYETSKPYTPFMRLFEELFGLGGEAADDDATRYAKVRNQVAELLPARVAEIAPFIATMLGIQFAGEDLERVKYLEPPQLRERTYHAVRDFFESLAGMRPLVLVFEDLHWADPSSLDLLEQLQPLTERARLFLVALFRPQQQEAAWRFHETAARDHANRYTPLILEPLDESRSRELVANLLHIEDLPEKVRALILKKAEGNPFFVEEVIRSLLDARLVVRDNSHWRATREIENIAVPDTLAGVITARLDRLDDNAKRTVQTASVIGREFPFDLLADTSGETEPVLDEALGNLRRRELIHDKGRAPQRAYLFKHALTQETAYASLLLRRRRELHRRVAVGLERTAREHAVGDIARHFLEAQDADSRARALPYLVEAGDRAARAYSTSEAIGLYTQALEILGTVEDLALARRAYEGLGKTVTLANDIPRAVETYQAMAELAQSRGDIPMQVSALNKLSFVIALRLGQFPEAKQRLNDAERLAREYQDNAGLSEHFLVRCMMCTAAADFEGVVHHMGEGAALGRKLNIKAQMATALNHVATSQIYMTRFDDAWGTAQEAMAVSKEIGDRQNEAALLAFTQPLYYLRSGDLDAARGSAEGGLTLAAKIGAANPEYDSAYILGAIAHLRGEYERAIAYFGRALQAARSGMLPWCEAMALGALGTAHLDMSPGSLEHAAEFHRQALQVMEQPGGMMLGAATWAELGRWKMAEGDLDAATEVFQKGLTIPTPPMYLERPRLLASSALVALARGQCDEAGRLANEARNYAEERAMKNLFPLLAFTDARVSAACGAQERALDQFASAASLALEMQMRPLAWQARAGAAGVLAALGRDDEADAKRGEARALVDEIADSFDDGDLRARYVESASRQIKA